MDFTIIITTSPINTNPDITMINCVINSIFKNIKSNFEKNIIISCDGVDEENKKYNSFINNLNEKYKSNNNISVIVNEKKGHLTGNIRNSIKYVNTKYILFVQHDLVIIKEINADKIIDDMEKNSKLKHVRLNKRTNQKSGWDNTNLFASEIIQQNYNYILTEAWSDQNHFTTKDYYLKNVLSNVDDGVFMEQVMNNICKGDHSTYGTYVFGKMDEERYIVHIDGADTRRGNLGAQCKKDREYYLNIFK